jgi:hypothetical protein
VKIDDLEQRAFEVACAINPKLFSTVPHEAHRAASPMSVEAARDDLLRMARRAIDAVENDRALNVADEYYARGYGLRCMILDHLNGAIDRDGLRQRFQDWEYRCSGTRFSTSPEQIKEWSDRIVS